ncbi:hypothetical protein HY478_01375 [Candidatus Uhrbacteria bacterium]|nr:hypothetical protein [Candidatus Uhrbacteria bacterium]
MTDEPKKGELIAAHDAKKMMTHDPALARRAGSVFIGTLNILAEPTRLLAKPLQKHFEKKYLGRYRHARKLFIFDMALLAALLVLAGIALWALFFRITLADKMVITVETTPEELVSGAQATFTVFYENRSKESISDVDLTVLLPAHFEFLRSFPREYNPRSGRVFLGTLAPGAHGQAKITGILWGEVGRPALVVSSLTFRSLKNQRYVKFVRSELPIDTSVLVLSLELPTRIVGGQISPFTLRYENTGPRDVHELSFIPQWPEGTVLVGAEPAQQDGQWQVGTLASGERGTITGSVRTPSDGGAFSFGFLPSVVIDDDTLKQARVALERSLIPEPFVLNATIDGARDSSVAAGSALTVRIGYENTGPTPLTDVSIGIRVASLLAPSEEILIDTTTEPALAEIPPGGTGTVSVPLTLRTRPVGILREPVANLLLEITPIARYTLPDGIPVIVQTSGTTLSRRIETPFDLSTAARYWTTEGEQIGRGPMPPVAGETTKYWVFWQLLPTTNKLEHVQFATTLPGHVAWTTRANVTIGSPIIWNPATRTVTWTIDQLDASAGAVVVVSARFEVALTPTIDQIGETPRITNETELTGRDLFTETDLRADAPALTTELTTDRRASGKARVQAP